MRIGERGDECQVQPLVDDTEEAQARARQLRLAGMLARAPAEVRGDKSVTSRVPTRTDDDDRYSQDRYQCMPLHGYTRMFERMIDHPNIQFLPGTDHADVRGAIR